MGFTPPYDQKNYLGEFGADATALTFIQTVSWDTNKDGTGNPEDGMFYFHTGSYKFRFYANGAWRWILFGDNDANAILADGSVDFVADQSMGGNNLTNVGVAISDDEAVNLGQVKSLLEGLDPKGSVQLATTAPLPANTRSGDVLTATMTGAFPSVDGVPPVLNYEYLVKDEVNQVNNGIYVLTVMGDGITPWQLTRRVDFNNGTAVAGAMIPVEMGTQYANHIFVCTNDKGTDIVNTDNILFTDWGTVIRHNDTTGKQGGQAVPEEYYHFTAAEWTALRGGNDASTPIVYHHHDGRYYTQTQLGSTTPGTEGASLIGTDTKVNLGNATTVEDALTNLDFKNPIHGPILGAAHNPNSGAGTPPLRIGRIYISTTAPYLRYINIDGTNFGWKVI